MTKYAIYIYDNEGNPQPVLDDAGKLRAFKGRETAPYINSLGSGSFVSVRHGSPTPAPITIQHSERISFIQMGTNDLPLDPAERARSYKENAERMRDWLLSRGMANTARFIPDSTIIGVINPKATPTP